MTVTRVPLSMAPSRPPEAPTGGAGSYASVYDVNRARPPQPSSIGEVRDWDFERTRTWGAPEPGAKDWCAPPTPNNTWTAPSISLPTVTKLDYQAFHRRVLGHPRISEALQQFTLQGIELGYHTGYEGVEAPFHHANLTTAAEHAGAVDAWVRAEQAEGRYTDLAELSDAQHPYMCTQAIGTVGKKSLEVDLLGNTILKWRLITHLSKPGPHGSINDGIAKEPYSLVYTTIEDICCDIMDLTMQHKDNRAHLTQFDLKNAFRQLPRHGSVLHLHTIVWRGKRLLDRALDFGGRSTPFIFDSLMLVLIELLKDDLKASGLTEGVDFTIRHLLDDLTAVSASRSTAEQIYKIGIALFQELGVVIQEKKSVVAARQSEVLGHWLDCAALTLSLPENKRLDYARRCRDMIGASTISRERLETLVGKLGFAHYSIPIGRSFVGQFYAAMHTLQAKHYTCKVLQEHRDALDFLLHLIEETPPWPMQWLCPKPQYGKEAHRDPFDPWYAINNDVVYCGDASGVDGMGFYCQNHVSFRRWDLTDREGISHRRGNAFGTGKERNLGDGTMIDAVQQAHALQSKLAPQATTFITPCSIPREGTRSLREPQTFSSWLQ